MHFEVSYGIEELTAVSQLWILLLVNQIDSKYMAICH